jgi:two-component system, LytTR family, response regulator
MEEKLIRAVIADDEPKARKTIQRMLKNYPEFDIIRMCSDGRETLAAILELKPDLVFLDIQMPEYNGFEILQKIEENLLPKIVFVTAYDEFALQAFEVHAIDYLMKPFDTARFNKAVTKAKELVMSDVKSYVNQNIKNLLETIRQHEKNKDKIMIKQDGKIFFLDTSDISHIESAGNYIKIITVNSQYMIRETMKNIEEKLSGDTFFRIHRSTIVNISNVKVIEPWFHGDYQITMNNGTQLSMSRNYKDLLKAF